MANLYGRLKPQFKELLVDSVSSSKRIIITMLSRYNHVTDINIGEALFLADFFTVSSGNKVFTLSDIFTYFYSNEDLAAINNQN